MKYVMGDVVSIIYAPNFHFRYTWDSIRWDGEWSNFLGRTTAGYRYFHMKTTAYKSDLVLLLRQ